ncbi:MAG TPA: 2-hydroxychromene-2-carboxylate isomerase [Candidatus Limnocylindrales bacterium]|nr:2-hydroxychromene-2-carboxylate isomerase [Candidatus Limnocylindrales bacterium]
MPVVEFWYEFASTYSYLAAMRVEAAAEAAGAQLAWRPFLLGPVFAAQGWNDSPFNIYPAKGRYMWRDMERLCKAARLPFRRPSRFPRNGLLCARVATLAASEGWCGAFTRAVYHANFAEDAEIGDASVVAGILAQLGRDGRAECERAQSPAVKDALRASTEEAMARGIFGAPTFTVGREMFWGNDRLDQALAWAGRTEAVPESE